ncbi:MAG TPA: MotA/TolQ/ExbB proton channel family protein [Phycisphaerae bacterium]|nr:MotA/TolQ/ExbB proton channel family protein [Phycisphaerae bacterium]
MMLALAGKTYFEIFILGGSYIGGLIILLSVVMVALAIQYFIQIRRTNVMPDLIRQQIQQLFDNKQYREAIELTAVQPDLLSYVVHAALAEAPHGYPAMERAMEESSEERTAKMLRQVEWMNLIGNVGPMMGLLGTVFGMILAFFKIVEAGGMPKPAALAESIGIALVTTMQGLVVAIPALAVYAAMRNRIDALSSETMKVAQDLVSAFRPAKKA